MSSFTAHSVLTPHDNTMIAWQQACVQAADALRPQRDRERLAKALTLAQEGAVTLDADGAALVVSHGTRYRIDEDGLCHCPDMQNRGCRVQAPPGSTNPPAGDRSTGSQYPSATPHDRSPDRAQPQRGPGEVTEAPASCCMRLYIGELELMYTMRDVHGYRADEPCAASGPWVQDVFDQARERQGQLDTRRQQRDAGAAGQAAVPRPPPRPASEPSDRHAGPDPAGGAAGACCPSRHQQGPARCPQPGPRPHTARQPGRLVRAPPGSDGAPQQCRRAHG